MESSGFTSMRGQISSKNGSMEEEEEVTLGSLTQLTQSSRKNCIPQTAVEWVDQMIGNLKKIVTILLVSRAKTFRKRSAAEDTSVCSTPADEMLSLQVCTVCCFLNDRSLKHCFSSDNQNCWRPGEWINQQQPNFSIWHNNKIEVIFFSTSNHEFLIQILGQKLRWWFWAEQWPSSKSPM